MARFRILVVDDNREVRHMLAEGVKTLGTNFDVLEVPSGEEALLISSSLSLDLVVTDVWLPGMSGLDLMTRLRKRTPDLKTILVTGVEEPRLRRQVAEAGATAFFYKPLDLADFLDAVERCLGLVKDAFPMPKVEDAPVVTVLKPGQAARPPQPIIEEVKPPLTLADRLSALRQELQLISAILIDDAGQVLAEAGNLPEVHADGVLHSALMVALSANLKVAHALGRTPPDDLLCFQGIAHSLCLAHAGEAYALVLFTKALLSPDQVALMRKAIPPALSDLHSILEASGASALPAPLQEPPAELVEVIPEVVDPSVLAEVDALFGKAAAATAGASDFWDTAIEQAELDGVSNADALSYEQARQLGLAPEDE